MFTKNKTWNENEYNKLVIYLNSLKDKKYLDFTKKLVTTKYNMIGIRIPILRDIAKKISKTDIFSFLCVVKSNSYEEVMIEGLVISYIIDVKQFIKYMNKYIKKIDNWAICDTFVSSIKIVKTNKSLFLKEIDKYLNSKDEFIVRIGLVLLLNYYVSDDYIDLIFEMIENINREEYYINMAIAWLISICFIKYKDKTYTYLKNNKLNKFTYNKSIQKIIESYRVSSYDKNILRTMRR